MNRRSFLAAIGAAPVAAAMPASAVEPRLARGGWLYGGKRSIGARLGENCSEYVFPLPRSLRRIDAAICVEKIEAIDDYLVTLSHRSGDPVASSG